MKLELTSTKINKVVGRKELSFKITETSTPSRADVRREIAVLMRTEIDNVYVRVLQTKAGTRVTTGIANVYNDATIAMAIEPKYIITRNKGKEATKMEDKPSMVTEKEKK
jgi:ribosomal protein S24E